MLMHENFLNSLRSTYLFWSSITSWSFCFILMFTDALDCFSRTWFLFILCSKIELSRSWEQSLADIARDTVSFVLIMELPEMNILFLSWGPSLNVINLLQLKYLHAFSICEGYPMKLIISFFYSMSFGTIPSILNGLIPIPSLSSLSGEVHSGLEASSLSSSSSSPSSWSVSCFWSLLANCLDFCIDIEVSKFWLLGRFCTASPEPPWEIPELTAVVTVLLFGSFSFDSLFF